MNVSPVLIVLVGLLVGGGLFYFSYIQAKKRRELFAGFAAQHGWSYLPTNNSLAGQWSGTPSSRHG